jgi:predicted DNA-binding protein with PD1-like motif
MFKQIHTFRVKPKEKLAESIAKFCQEKGIVSGVIISLLGSLNSVDLGFLKKLPGQFITKKFDGPLEIVNATGTIALTENKPVIHIHIEVSNENGAIGGHLVEAEIFSTAEVVIGELDQQIKRQKDEFTGLNELI